jgi:1-deoxy-D-xylulose-5-phosphate reductoisomerase
MNAANEVAVSAFLRRQIGFLEIAATVGETLETMDAAGDLAGGAPEDALEWSMAIDAAARRVAAQVLSRFGRMA